MGDGTRENPYTQADVINIASTHGGTLDFLDFTGTHFKGAIDFREIKSCIGTIFNKVVLQYARFEGVNLKTANFVDAYMANIIPIEVLGFRIHLPQGIVFTLWLFLVLPADFALWTAMSRL